MKILHISTSDISGGAARAAYRLHLGLLKKKINSRMLVQNKYGDGPNVYGPKSRIGKGLAIFRPDLDTLPMLLHGNRPISQFSPSILPLSRIIKNIEKINPELIHLHWVAGGFLKIEDLVKINKPIVWSLHDMWALTGGCHYDDGCGRYTGGCGSCPVLRSTDKRDLSYRILRRKQKSFTNIASLTINAVSTWLADCATKSSLIRNRSVVNLPNPIDCKIFKPYSKTEAKRILEISKKKQTVLFGAINATKDKRKGFRELSQALQHISENRNIELIVFGSSPPSNATKFSFPAKYIGRLHDDISLRLLYCASDVMVVPSKQEAFGQTATEAMACGTPVVAFRSTGLLDIVDHKINGYLAEPFDPLDLANGIEWVLDRNRMPTDPKHRSEDPITDFTNRRTEETKILEENYSFLTEISKNSRRKILEKFDSSNVADKYIKLYEKLCENKYGNI